MPKPKILIIEDEEAMQETLTAILGKDYHVRIAQNGCSGLKMLKKELFSIILLDLNLPDQDGIEILKQIKKFYCSAQVIIVTASNDIKRAVACMQLSAFHYITKPFEVDELLAVINKAESINNILKENEILKESLKESLKYSELIGKSDTAEKLRSLVKTIARTKSTVLITGESGTGKEIVAKEIHRLSLRSANPMIAINCAAIPDNLLESELFGHERGAFTGAIERKLGKFELAQNSTLFLDEIGCMNHATQSKLLRVLEEKAIVRVGGNNPIPIDARIIAATNINIKKAIQTNSFREDLFYRLNVIPIELTPLRERRQDIPHFVNYFILKFNKLLNKNIKSLTPESQVRLNNYHFPGNVRELQNIIERAAVLTQNDVITDEHLYGINKAKTANIHLSLRDACLEFEKKHIQESIASCSGNLAQAARVLGIARSTLNSKLNALGIKHQAGI